MRKIPKTLWIILIAGLGWTAWHFWLDEYLDYKKAIKSSEGCRYFLDERPDSRYTPAVKERIEQLDYMNSLFMTFNPEFPAPDTGYLAQYPNGKFRKECIDALDSMYLEYGWRHNDIAVVIEGLRRYPGEKFTDRMNKFIDGGFAAAKSRLAAKQEHFHEKPDPAFLRTIEWMASTRNCEIPLVITMDNRIKDWNEFSPAVQMAADENKNFGDQFVGLPSYKDSPPKELKKDFSDLMYKLLRDSAIISLDSLFADYLGVRMIHFVLSGPEATNALKGHPYVQFNYTFENEMDGDQPVVVCTTNSQSHLFQSYSLSVQTNYTAEWSDGSSPAFKTSGIASPESSIEYQFNMSNWLFPSQPTVTSSIRMAQRELAGRMGLVLNGLQAI